MSQHVSTVCRSVNYHICNIEKIGKYIYYNTCLAAARALVLSRLDYCSSLLNCIIQKDLIRFQKLQNNTARQSFIPKQTHSSPLLDEFHSLSVHQKIHLWNLGLIPSSVGVTFFWCFLSSFPLLSFSQLNMSKLLQFVTCRLYSTKDFQPQVIAMDIL